MENIPRLDVLLYAHDGRGLGHASRTIAIGMALRRLYPKLRILFITGCNISQELIGSASLDWLKLPSYETQVVEGKSRGVSGKSNFTDSEQGILRSEQIRQVVQLYRPKVVLVDHSPQGKHRELLAAQEESKNYNSIWILGIRAVIGEVSQIQSDLARSLFKKAYTSLLWYGDSNVLGSTQLENIQHRFAIPPIECGYVSRLRELIRLKSNDHESKIAATVSIPWIGEKTPEFLYNLYQVLKNIGDKYGEYHLYLDFSDQRSEKSCSLLQQLPFCTVERPNQNYLTSLMQSKCAVIYGGYNSLMDILSLSMPSLVILRDMIDDEQQQHLEKLVGSAHHLLTPLVEHCTRENLATALVHTLEQSTTQNAPKIQLNLNGAENAAHHISQQLING